MSDTKSGLVNAAKALTLDQEPKNKDYKDEIAAFIEEIGKERGHDEKFPPEKREDLLSKVTPKMKWADQLFVEFDDKVRPLEKMFENRGESEDETLAGLKEEFEFMSRTHGDLALLEDEIKDLKSL